VKPEVDQDDDWEDRYDEDGNDLHFMEVRMYDRPLEEKSILVSNPSLPDYEWKYSWKNRIPVYEEPTPVDTRNCPRPRFPEEYSSFPFEDVSILYDNDCLNPEEPFRILDPTADDEQTEMRNRKYMKNHELSYRFSKTNIVYARQKLRELEVAKLSDAIEYDDRTYELYKQSYDGSVLEESKHWAERTIPKREALCLAMHPRLGEKSLLSFLEPELFQSIVMAAL